MIDAEWIIHFAGYFAYWAILLIVFAESGLLIGFFLPGDSLLFTAGFFASQNIMGLSLLPLLIGVFLAAVIGDSVGYTMGKRFGPKIFKKEESLLFKPKYIKQAQDFYELHGGKTIIIARFVPIVRTFAPIVAGVGEMKYPRFLAYNVIGGFIWSFGFILLGFMLGNIPGMEQYTELAVLVILFISLLPVVHHLMGTQEKRRNIINFSKSYFKRIVNKN